MSWTELEKRMLRQRGTHTKFRNLMRWLTRNNYIVKMGGVGSRAPYKANTEIICLVRFIYDYVYGEKENE